MEISIEKKMITPWLAGFWLRTGNDTNRNISQPHVRRLAEAIRKDQFELGDSIKLDFAGTLIDGQHRLSAVILADKSVEMLVTRGYESASMAVLDIGKKRSTADVAVLSGKPLNNKQIAVARAILLPHRDTAKYRILTTQDIIQHTTALLPFIDFGIAAIKNLPTQSVIQSIIARGLICCEDSERLKEFGRICSDGVCLKQEDTAALRLREFTLDRRGTNRCGQDEFLRAQGALVSFLNRQPRSRSSKSNGILFPIGIDKLFQGAI